jgi:hypothetical protein
VDEVWEHPLKGVPYRHGFSRPFGKGVPISLAPRFSEVVTPNRKQPAVSTVSLKVKNGC